jgi:ribosomal protein S18 acetylase RimI-like enzyme
MMSSSLHLRLLTEADLPLADRMRALAGWNQTLADWKRFLTDEPEGCFLAEWHRVPAGTATTICYSPALAWIGMVLVHPDYRRRGIGRALLERCIEHLRERRVRCIKLDATPAGRPLYDGLGFKEEWTLTRWERAATSKLALESRSGISSVDDTDGIDLLDATAFGVSRKRLISALVKQCLCALLSELQPGRIDGYGILRDGSAALYLGPVVAGSADTGTRLADALLARTAGRKVFWDIPDQNSAAVRLAETRGFTKQRPLTRLYLGENTTPGDPQRQLAIAGPELG